MQEKPVAAGHEVSPEDEYISALSMILVPDRGLDRLHHRFERVLEILYIGGGFRIEDHQIGGDPFEVPILVRPQ